MHELSKAIFLEKIPSICRLLNLPVLLVTWVLNGGGGGGGGGRGRGGGVCVCGGGGGIIPA